MKLGQTEAPVPTTSREGSRRELGVSISIRTILLVAVVVAAAAALASIKSVLLLLFVSFFGVAVLSPVATAMERRLGWSRRACSMVLVLGIVGVIAAVALVMVQALNGAVLDFSHQLPHIVDRAKQSDLGNVLNTRSGSLDTLAKHAGEITKGAGNVSGGVAHVGISAFGGVTLFFSVLFLTLFGLIEEPHLREWTAGLMYRDKRERYLRVTDRIIHTTSRYMLGNLAISVICGTVYGVTAVILGLPYPLALAVIAAILDLVPNIGATIAGVIIGIVALSVEPAGAGRLLDRDRRLPVDRELHPAADDHREGCKGLRLHRARERPDIRRALRVDRGDHRRADRGSTANRRGRTDRRQTCSHRRGGRKGCLCQKRDVLIGRACKRDHTHHTRFYWGLPVHGGAR